MKRTWPIMTLVMLAIFVVMTGVAMTYPEGARFQPLVIGLPAIALCLLQLVLDLRAKPAGDVTVPAQTPLRPDSESPPALRRELIVWSYLLGFVAAILLVGFWIAIPCFLVAFLRLEAKAGWPLALGLGLGATGILYALFALVLRVSLHEGWLLQALR